MKLIKYILALLLLQPAYADTTIVLLRHGEKPAQGLGQLSCQGFNRSLALAPLLLANYGKPVAIYAPNPGAKKIDSGQAYAYIRPLATIEPFAISVGMPVNLDYGMMQVGELAKELLARNEGTQIVAWEHHLAAKLARVLLMAQGANAELVPDWNDSDFDSIYIVHVAGQLATFSLEHQGLNNLSASCKQ